MKRGNRLDDINEPGKQDVNMETKVGVGESKKINPFEAGVEAAQMAMVKAGLQECDFVFLFATAGYEQEPMLKGVRSVTGTAPLSGCSGEGIITQSGPAGEGMFGETGLIKGEEIVGVMVFSSDKIKFFNYASQGLKTDSQKAGLEIGREIKEARVENPLALLMFPDGMTINSKDFFEGIDAVIEKPLLFCGGSAGENLTFNKTYQYHNDKVLTDSASCVLISGKAEIEVGVNHGCEPISLERTITKSKKNNIYEIDNKPAWDFFKKFLPNDANEFTAELVTFFALGEKLAEDLAPEYDKYIIRVPMGQNADGSLYINTEMPTGTKVHMMRRDDEKVSLGAKKLAEKIKNRIGDKKPIAVFHFDCAARGKRLFGEDTKQMGIDVIQNVFDKDIPWLGFYSYGEIAPIAKKNYIHTVTVVLLVIY